MPSFNDPCAMVNSKTGVRLALVVDDIMVKGKASGVKELMDRYGRISKWKSEDAVLMIHELYTCSEFPTRLLA